MSYLSKSWNAETLHSSRYFPPFLWKFLMNKTGPKWNGENRVHIYDTTADEFVETRRIPQQKNVFCDFATGHLEEECQTALRQLEHAFTRLEADAELALMTILRKIGIAPGEMPKRQTIQLGPRDEDALRRYLIFLRWRNSNQYHDTVARLGAMASKTHPWLQWIPKGALRRRAVLRSIKAFLEHDSRDQTPIQAGFIEDINEHCWRPYREANTELYVGVASEDQEFIFTDRAYGNLLEVDPDGSYDGSYHLYFPITPTVAIYLMIESPSTRESASLMCLSSMEDYMDCDRSGKRKRHDDNDDETLYDIHDNTTIRTKPKRSRTMDQVDMTNLNAAVMSMLPDSTREVGRHSPTPSISSTTTLVQGGPGTTHVNISCDVESVPDVHLRNAMLLRDCPGYILFSSLPSMVTAITIYDPSRSDAAHMDLSALKLHCRQKHIREGLRKTLVVRDSVTVPDLTEEVVLFGQTALKHGSFADIWKGEWVERANSARTVVALKVLRQCMADNVKEKLLKRLSAEVRTWYQLRHPNIAPLYGIAKLPHTLAMVSPWCQNGTVVNYLKDINPNADRLLLILQIASGVAYLHNYKPIVIHADLKGNNILVDDTGKAVITDFGVSQVLEDDSSSLAGSLFSGATRWMAPEVVRELMSTEDKPPTFTPQTDVYAFASTCLEILTDQVPFPNRHPWAVGMDKIRGVKPSRPSENELYGMCTEFWAMLDQCWDEWYMRPTMSDLTVFLGGLLSV